MKTKSLALSILQVDATVNEYAIQTVCRIYKEIINPSLRDPEIAQVAKNSYTINHRNLGIAVPLLDYKSKDCDWIWGAFNMLTTNPVNNDKTRRGMSLVNIGCIAESISQIRRMLMVKSATNPRNVYSYVTDGSILDLPDDVRSAEQFLKCEPERQFEIAGRVFFAILTIIIMCHPKRVESQIIVGEDQDIRLVIWGNFKHK